jgi:hypothetical protein
LICALALIATLFTLVLGQSEASADECVLPSEPHVAVTIKPASLEQDHTLTRTALAAHVRSTGLSYGGYDGVLGLTETVISSQLSTRRATKPDGHGGFCAVVFSADITLEWKTAKRIAAELKYGSCMYDAVSKHEQKHVDVDRQYLAAAKARIEKGLRDAIRTPIIAATEDQGKKTAQENASKALDAIIDSLLAELDRAQREDDTAAAYAEARETCGDAAYDAAFAK